MENLLYGCDIVSMKDLPLPRIKLILKTAAKLKAQRALHLLNNKIIAHCFFEPSTRTRLSFEAATLRLGGNVIGFSSDEALSIQKGETLHDTVKVVSEYADLIIIRHPNEGAARLAADVAPVPVINAGDGANQHPTQTLIDLFTIQECQKSLDGLAIALVGDLKYGRTIHSFAQACMLLDVRLFLVAPEPLALPQPLCDTLKKVGVRFSFHQSIEEVIPKVDILYMTRIQQERFNEAEYQQIRKQYILKPEMFAAAKSNLKVLHPLPRVNEIDISVDNTPYAYYFEQAANGVYVRQALLSLLLNKEV
jgi:aspartate carbamoyltransferase catalytic subunit